MDESPTIMFRLLKVSFGDAVAVKRERALAAEAFDDMGERE